MSILSSILLGTLFLVAFASSASLSSSKIQSNVVSHFAKSGQDTADVLISFHAGTASKLAEIKSQIALNSYTESTRHLRIESVVTALEAHAQQTQKRVLDLLTSAQALNSVTAESLWITNQVFVQNANAELVTALAALDEVSAISLNEIIPLDEPLTPTEQESANPKPEWGISNIRADAAWSVAGGNTGEGVIVAAIDTGVRWTHEAIKSKYLGSHGWYDPYTYSNLPHDHHGHGTHVTGTMVGDFGIGVAPGAKWSHCRGCGELGCEIYALIMCGQFVICPFLPDGSGRDCTKAPHIVNNSWNGGQGQIYFVPIVEAWLASGIIPVVSAGNTGSACSTSLSPADLSNVISVGATDALNSITYFSSRGPTVNGLVKPDISAPGSNIRSCTAGSDKEYTAYSGTSMAAPHLSGVLALLKSADPTLNYERARQYLIDGADQNLKFSGNSCGGTTDSEWPNNFFGHGKVNAMKSLVKLWQDTSKLCDIVPILCEFIC